MKWTKFMVKTITDAEDIIISTLYDIGLEGAQIEDKIPLTPLEKEQMFVDILPDGPEDDGIAYLSFFVEEKEGGSLELLGEKVTTEEIVEKIRNYISIMAMDKLRLAKQSEYEHMLAWQYMRKGMYDEALKNIASACSLPFYL